METAGEARRLIMKAASSALELFVGLDGKGSCRVWRGGRENLPFGVYLANGSGASERRSHPTLLKAPLCEARGKDSSMVTSGVVCRRGRVLHKRLDNADLEVDKATTELSMLTRVPPNMTCVVVLEVVGSIL